MNEIVQIISTLGFPIAMYVGACFFINYQFDPNAKQMEDLRKEHKEEIKQMTDAINNNTLVIQKLVDKIDKEG